MDIDDHGAELPKGGGAPKLVILTPSHQYPLGGAMSPNRRLDFIHWAQKNEAWVIEDDYDSEFRYAGRPIPAMAGFDKLNRTIYVGSFSKIFSNSLRLGYVILPDDLVRTFEETITRFGVKASYMPQQALAEFMASGEFYRHLRRVRRIYGDRRKYLLNALTQDFSEFGFVDDHQAGMQLVFQLNGKIADTDIAMRAAQKGVTVQPLSGFYVSKSGVNGLILGFCGYSETEMSPSLQFLLTCFQEADSKGHFS